MVSVVRIQRRAAKARAAIVIHNIRQIDGDLRLRGKHASIRRQHSGLVQRIRLVEVPERQLRRLRQRNSDRDSRQAQRAQRACNRMSFHFVPPYRQ
jgi:hypothetical protein